MKKLNVVEERAINGGWSYYCNNKYCKCTWTSTENKAKWLAAHYLYHQWCFWTGQPTH